MGPITVSINGNAPITYTLADITVAAITKGTTAITQTVTVASSPTGGTVEILGVGTSQSPTTLTTGTLANGLTVAIINNALSITGTPSTAGTGTVYVRARVNGTVYEKSFTVTVTDPTKPSLSVASTYKTLTGTVGTAWPTTLSAIPVTGTGGTGTVEIASVTPSAAIPGLTFGINTAKTGITISGTPTAATATAVTLTIAGKVGASDANSETITITISAATTPTTPALSVATLLPFTVGTAVEAPVTATINVTPAATVAATALSGSGSAVDVLTRSWNGLEITASGNKITVKAADDNLSKSPTEAGVGTFTVAGTAGGVAATPATFTITVSPAQTPAPPAPTPTISLTPKSLPFTVGQSVNSTITVNPSSGTVVSLGVKPVIWNDLNLTVSGTTITIAGKPSAAGTSTFTVTGTISGTSVSDTFTITVTAAAPSVKTGNLFQAPSEWTKQRTGNSIVLNLPVTQDFIDLFDTNSDDVISNTELARVRANVTSPNAAYSGITAYSISNGVLHATLGFTPATGYEDDWYESVTLNTIEILGANGVTVEDNLERFGGGVDLDEDVPDVRRGGGGGGCDVGGALLALLLLAPLTLRKKS